MSKSFQGQGRIWFDIPDVKAILSCQWRHIVTPVLPGTAHFVLTLFCIFIQILLSADGYYRSINTEDGQQNKSVSFTKPQIARLLLQEACSKTMKTSSFDCTHAGWLIVVLPDCLFRQMVYFSLLFIANFIKLASYQNYSKIQDTFVWLFWVFWVEVQMTWQCRLELNIPWNDFLCSLF